MQPELDLGPITLQTFGICFAFAFLASGPCWPSGSRSSSCRWTGPTRSSSPPPSAAWSGSRVDYLIQHWDDVSDDLLGNLFSGSGLVWFGGLVGGALGVILWARWRGFLEWRLFDACAPALALGYAVGRIGCQLSGDGDYGKPTDSFLGMSYPEGTVPTTEDVWPTPVFETVAMALVALLLWRLRDRFRPGLLFGLYLLLAGTERLLIEFIRRNDAVVAGLTQPQLIGVAMIIGGAVLVYVKRQPAAQAPQAA